MIQLESAIVELLINFYNSHQDDIYCIWVGGSASLSYITMPHDIDIIITWKHRYHTKEGVQQHILLRNQIKSINPKYQLINRYADKYDEAFENHWPIYAYLYIHPQIIVGSVYKTLLQFDILKYPNRIWKTIEELIDTAAGHKYFYHLLTDLYILWNQSYDLTEEQIQNICIVHDQQDKKKIEELYQWALQQTQG